MSSDARKKLFGSLGQRPAARLEIGEPIRLDAGQAVLPLEQMAGRKLLDSRNQRVGAGNVVQRKIVMKPGRIERAGNLAVAEERFELRAEVDVRAAPMQVKGLDADPVPAQHQTSGRLAPERDGEHPAKAREAAHIPLE